MLGNHDVDPINQVRPFEAERRTVTLYAAGDPPLLQTHVPLLQVPHGAVNVHGHVHERESPTRNRHVNVSVEQSELPAGEAERHPPPGAPAGRRTQRAGSQHPSAAERRRARDAVAKEMGMKTLTLKAGGATFHIRRNGSGWAARSPISEEHGCGHGEAARRSTRR